MSGRREGIPGQELLHAARVVLIKPRFPENIGMAARACANMGMSCLRLVKPELWDLEHQEKALSLATSQGEPLVRGAACFASLREAVADCHFVLGTTARTGGWRRRVLSPAAAGEKIVGRLAQGQQAALVFGPEDRGLLNEEIELCTAIACIPTAAGAASLNLAQAVLILAYECLRAAEAARFAGAGAAPLRPDGPAGRDEPGRPGEKDTAGAPRAFGHITHAEQEMLFAAMTKVLKTVDFLPQDNSDYFLLPLREFMHSRPLKRGEFSMLMGVCRQVLWALGKK